LWVWFFLAAFSIGRLRMVVLVPPPFLFASVLEVAGVVMGWWWLKERGGKVVVVGGAKVFVFVPWWSCFMGREGLVTFGWFWCLEPEVLG
jgi:hypothetical protein